MDIGQALSVVDAKCDVDTATLKRIYRDGEQRVFGQRAARGLLESNATAVFVKDEFNGIIQEKARQYLDRYAAVLLHITDYPMVETCLQEHFRKKLDAIYSEACHALQDVKRKLQLTQLDVHLRTEYETAMRSWLSDITLLVANSRKAAMNQPSIVYNFHGPNARVNNNSIDASTNVVNATEQQLFADLRRAIERLNDDAGKHRLLAAADDLQAQSDKQGRAASYLKFVEHAANHITALSPFLPALAQWASQ